MVSVRRVAPVLLLLMALPAFAQPKQSSTPPKELHKVGDHWTAYFPPDPATYPPNARTHTIVAGNTLWGLAQEYYGNGYLWPQLWENNTWITDAHWIYPGDVLLVGGEASQAAVTTETAVGQAETTTTTEEVVDPSVIQQGGLTATLRERPPIPLGSEFDVYCYGYIGHPDEPMPNYISGFEDVEVMYQPGVVTAQEAGAATGDLVYVAGGTSSGLVAGETYILVEPGEVVVHPRTGAFIGQHYNYQGQVRILCAEDGQSRGMIVQACREIKAGSRLKPLPQLPIPIARVPDLPAFCDPPTGRSTGFIVDSLDWDLGLGEGNLVQVNLGRDDQIQPGDFLLIYRDSPIPGQPRQVLGEIGVLTTESRTATGRIVQSRRTIFVGDYVEMR